MNQTGNYTLENKIQGPNICNVLVIHILKSHIEIDHCIGIILDYLFYFPS